MDNFQSITASPEALAAFLGSIPAIETPWDEAFNRLCCSSCSAALSATIAAARSGITRFGGSASRRRR